MKRPRKNDSTILVTICPLDDAQPFLRCVTAIFCLSTCPFLSRIASALSLQPAPPVVLYTPARENTLKRKFKSKGVQSLFMYLVPTCIFAVDNSILKLIFERYLCVMCMHIFSNNHCIPTSHYPTLVFYLSQTYRFSLLKLNFETTLVLPIPKERFIYRIVVLS